MRKFLVWPNQHVGKMNCTLGKWIGKVGSANSVNFLEAVQWYLLPQKPEGSRMDFLLLFPSTWWIIKLARWVGMIVFPSSPFIQSSKTECSGQQKCIAKCVFCWCIINGMRENSNFPKMERLSARTLTYSICIFIPGPMSHKLIWQDLNLCFLCRWCNNMCQLFRHLGMFMKPCFGSVIVCESFPVSQKGASSVIQHLCYFQ